MQRDTDGGTHSGLRVLARSDEESGRKARVRGRAGDEGTTPGGREHGTGLGERQKKAMAGQSLSLVSLLPITILLSRQWESTPSLHG